jgi:hypothetical protein
MKRNNRGKKSLELKEVLVPEGDTRLEFERLTRQFSSFLWILFDLSVHTRPSNTLKKSNSRSNRSWVRNFPGHLMLRVRG